MRHVQGGKSERQGRVCRGPGEKNKSYKHYTAPSRSERRGDSAADEDKLVDSQGTKQKSYKMTRARRVKLRVKLVVCWGETVSERAQHEELVS